VARTVAMAQIKEHYYTTHDELNPKRIIPVGPAYDWSEPHGRGQFPETHTPEPTGRLRSLHSKRRRDWR